MIEGEIVTRSLARCGTFGAKKTDHESSLFVQVLDFRHTRYNKFMNSHRLQGLSEEEVSSRRSQYGENILLEKRPPLLLLIFFRQFKSPLVYTLALVSMVSLIFREYTDFWIIFTVIFINSLIGAYQEHSAESTFAALKNVLKPKTLVIRNGKRKEINVSELVPQDIVVLTAGDKIPADGKVLEATNLVVDEAIFTGEEEPVTKSQSNKLNLFMGTKILAGIGIMEVMKTGMLTEIGKINESLSKIKEEETPLQRKLNQFSRKLILVVAAIAVIIFVLGLFRQQEIWSIFRISLILAVASIPEGIPIASTVIMALGMRRILKKNGLVKNLLSIETLGSTSVICTDKTGTLTKGVMSVIKTNFSDENRANLSMILSNQKKDTLEISLWDYVNRENDDNAEKIMAGINKSYEDPFDSSKKYSLTITKDKSKESGYILGAPEIVLNFCDLDQKEKDKIEQEIRSWAREGLKVVGAAYKDTGDIKKMVAWKWLGIVGIDDPIREEAIETIEKCRKAGIIVKIVTGDYRETAMAIGERLGFTLSDENVIDNTQLEKMSVTELAKKVGKIQIFARVTPDQKLKIVETLQKNGEVVGMTGDGVNDVLALKKADIGIVVASATDVAKEVSDLVLLDSNFATIYAACEEGRTISANIKKSIGYALSDSFVEMVVITLAILLGFPTIITIVMILWINLICDGPNDILLGFEPKEPDIMKISPKVIQSEKIFDKLIMSITAIISLTVGVMSLIYFWYIQKTTGDLTLARTVVFASIAFASLVYIFSFKNLKKPLTEIENFRDNKYLFWGVGSGFLLIIAAIYIPILNILLGTSPLSFGYWMPVIFIGVASLFFVELLKHLNR